MAKDIIDSKNKNSSATTEVALTGQENQPLQQPLKPDTNPQAICPNTVPQRSTLEEDTLRYRQEKAERERLGKGIAANAIGIPETPPARLGYSHMWGHDDSKLDGRDIAKMIQAGYRLVPYESLQPVYQAMYQRGVDGTVRNGDLMLYEILAERERDNRDQAIEMRNMLNAAAVEKLDAREADGTRRFVKHEINASREMLDVSTKGRVPVVEDNIFN